MTSRQSPYESHVQGMLTFALGVITGAEISCRGDSEPGLNPDNIPSAYVFAGGRLDQLSGDALLETGQLWLLRRQLMLSGSMEDRGQHVGGHPSAFVHAHGQRRVEELLPRFRAE